MDLSALIFVALAVAWAVYLIPKALKHHDEVQRSRSVERFSHRMRVLARREAVSRRDARLVVAPRRQPSTRTVETKVHSSAPPVPPAPSVVRRPASAVAARRRRRVLGLLVLATAVVTGLAAAHLVAWPWTAVPAGLLVAWLVACRVSVRAERRLAVRRTTAPRIPLLADLAPEADLTEVEPDASVAEPVDQVAPEAEPEVALEPGMWDPVPVTLPTYVDKPAAAQRTVRTIDLDATGVWSSGRHHGDSALAREAEAADRAARETARQQRATGT